MWRFCLRMQPILLVAALTVVTKPAQVLAQERSTGETTTSEAEGYFTEPRAIAKGIDFAVRTMGGGDGDRKDGFYPETGAMITGAGWISAGPGYRHRLFDDRAIVDVSAAYSWRGYKAAQARFELPNLIRSRLAVGTQYRWQDLTQVDYFGEGTESLESNRSEYRLRSHNVVGYGRLQPVRWLSLQARTGWLYSPELLSPVGHFKRGFPSTLEMFPGDMAVTRGDQPNYLHGNLSVVADTRDHRSHPVRGGVYRAEWATYNDRDGGLFSFRRTELEAAHFVPLSSDRIVFALRGWGVVTDTDPGRTIPFYLLPSLGGHNTLRGFNDYRFHDRNMLVVNAETRVAIFTHMDGAVFIDAGNVAARARDLNLDRTSYGIGLRMHSSRATFARFDVARSREGWQIVFRLNDPLRLSRLSVRTAAAPFVP